MLGVLLVVDRPIVQGGELTLLGQDELDLSVLEESFREQLERDAGHGAWSPLETERILLAAARVGVTAGSSVLPMCSCRRRSQAGSRCVRHRGQSGTCQSVCR
jgi:hypothetical protein